MKTMRDTLAKDNSLPPSNQGLSREKESDSCQYIGVPNHQYQESLSSFHQQTNSRVQLNYNSATGYSQYYLLLGRSPRLPINILLPSHTIQSQWHSEFAKKWKDQMSEQPLDKRKKKDTRRHDQHIPSSATLQPGGRVLVTKGERHLQWQIQQ